MKANVENLKISYLKKLKCWAIPSKYVCLCDKDRISLVGILLFNSSLLVRYNRIIYFNT